MRTRSGTVYTNTTSPSSSSTSTAVPAVRRELPCKHTPTASAAPREWVTGEWVTGAYCVSPQTTWTGADKFAADIKELVGLDINASEVYTIRFKCGRTDIVFAVHHDDVGKMAVCRFQWDIKWLCDIVVNDDHYNGRGHENVPMHTLPPKLVQMIHDAKGEA
jgi:hypothetical protein